MHRKVLETGVLPAPWISSRMSDSTIGVYQFSSGQPPCIVFMLNLLPDASWTLLVGQKKVPVHQLQLFQGLPFSLSSADDVISIAKFITDNTKFCVGNPDEKFNDLVSLRKGKFMDCRGKLLEFLPIANCMHVILQGRNLLLVMRMPLLFSLPQFDIVIVTSSYAMGTVSVASCVRSTGATLTLYYIIASLI
jgi:hypothetical protein